MKNIQTSIVIVLCLVAIIFFIYRLSLTVTFLNSSIGAQAKIVEVYQPEYGRHEVWHRENIFEFQTARGERVQTRVNSLDTIMSFFSNRSVGSLVEVKYNPSDPNNFKPNTFWGLWGGDLFGLLTSALALIVAIKKGTLIAVKRFLIG